MLDHKVTLFLVFPEWLLQLTFPPTLRDPFPAHRAHSHSLIITETWKLGVWLKIFSLSALVVVLEFFFFFFSPTRTALGISGWEGDGERFGVL